MDDDDCDDLLVDQVPDAIIDEDFVNNEIIRLDGSFSEIQPIDVRGEQSSGFKTIHLAHFSVRQYLLSRIPDKSVLFSDNKFQSYHLAKLCLRYLNYAKTWDLSSLFEHDRCRRPFLDAVQSWYLHVDAAGENYREVICLVNRPFSLGNPNWGY